MQSLMRDACENLTRPVLQRSAAPSGSTFFLSVTLAQHGPGQAQ